MEPDRFDIGEPSALDVQFLDDRLYEFNSDITGIDDGRSLSILMRDDESKRVVAGAAGYTWGGTCELRQVWVAPHLRGRGIGWRLMVEAQAQAVLRGCQQLVLTTHSFQAPQFYLKLGFEVVAELSDYPRGHSQVVLRKRLSPSTP